MENLQLDHTFYMKLALKEANKAAAKNEVPVGAIIVDSLTGKIVAKGHNLVIQSNNPTAHAEIIAIKKAAKYINNYRLNDCFLYTTLEPCPMCAGAIMQSRIAEVYFGASDEKGGAVVNNVELFSNKFNYNHKVLFKAGICEQECSSLLKGFFIKLRNKQTMVNKN